MRKSKKKYSKEKRKKKTEENPSRTKDFFKNWEEKAEEEMTFSNGQD
ncbi:hypothetical protein [sulfur-oxidizing endosymbiont of Gigantopelta aegis]|nr:hypothetical protein [sulfur-oxidizing endosymbiont of Gigantopelta aegis]